MCLARARLGPWEMEAEAAGRRRELEDQVAVVVRPEEAAAAAAAVVVEAGPVAAMGLVGLVEAAD